MNRKDFIKLGLLGIGSLSAPIAFSKGRHKSKGITKLNGRSLKASELKLKTGDSLIGPGVVMLSETDEALTLDGKNIYVLNVTFKAKNTKKQHDSVLELTENSENITIEGCSFEGDRYCVLKADSNSTKDKDLYFKNPAKNIKFLKNVINGFSRHLYFHSVHGSLIEGNTFKNSKRDSIRLRQNVLKTSIVNNRFSNTGSGSKESSDAVDAYWSGEELIINGNHIDGCDSHGLDIKGLSPDKTGKTSKVIISSNIIQNCRYSGILLSSGAFIKGRENFIESIIISDNIILRTNLKGENPNDAGIFARHGVQGAIIRGNEIRPHHGHGVVVGNFEDRAEQSKTITISSNQISVKKKSDHCVLALGVAQLIVAHNILKAPKGARPVKAQKNYRKFKAEKIVINENIQSED